MDRAQKSRLGPHVNVPLPELINKKHFCSFYYFYFTLYKKKDDDDDNQHTAFLHIHMDFRKLLPFPLEKYPTDKKKSSTTLKSANPRSQQLEDNPKGQGRTQVSPATRQAHIKTASWVDCHFNATDPGSGYPFSLMAPTSTTSKG